MVNSLNSKKENRKEQNTKMFATYKSILIFEKKRMRERKKGTNKQKDKTICFVLLDHHQNVHHERTRICKRRYFFFCFVLSFICFTVAQASIYTQEYVFFLSMYMCIYIMYISKKMMKNYLDDILDMMNSF